VVKSLYRFPILVALMAGACVHANAQPSAAQIAGCYELDRRVFIIANFNRATRTSRVDSTAVMRLYAEPMATTYGGGRGLRVTPIPAHIDSIAARRWLGISHWYPLPADSFYVEWRDGLWGPVLRLAIRDSLLEGTVLHTTDAYIEGTPRPTPRPTPQPIGGRRIACPS
jgi:hypothetical protein